MGTLFITDKRGIIKQIEITRNNITYLYTPNDQYAYTIIDGELDDRIKCDSYTDLQNKIRN